METIIFVLGNLLVGVVVSTFQFVLRSSFNNLRATVDKLNCTDHVERLAAIEQDLKWLKEK